MKICAIICEYNPFHNGHLWHIREAKRLSGADAVLCLMSGNFVQRGEAAIMDKFTRAKHAVQAGADIVLELPTPFATSNAELFAKGAVWLLHSIPNVTTLCFGAETADKTAFKLGARYLLNEPEEVSKRIQKQVSTGISYAKARANAFAGFIPFDMLESPNNILGLEYTKALTALQSDIDILPIQRIGAGYTSTDLQGNLSSATAIRQALRDGLDCQNQVPDFVQSDFPNHIQQNLDTLEKYALLATQENEIARICDCTEGLEHAFKRASQENAPLVESLTSARYTASRIRRIALQNLLKIDEKLIRNALCKPLYLRVLATKKAREDVLSALSESTFPLLLRPRDAQRLDTFARECYERDIFAEDVYQLLYPSQKKKIDIFVE